MSLVGDINNYNKSLEKLLKKEINNGSLFIHNKTAFDEFVESIKPEKEYDEYLKDKRVAIVGPSKYLLSRRSSMRDKQYVSGAHIDSHDVVVRIKCEEFLPFHENKEMWKKFKQIGSTANVIYSWKKLTDPEDWSERFETCGLRFFRTPNAEVIRECNKKRPDIAPARHIVRKFFHIDTQFDQYGFSKYACQTARSDKNLDFYVDDLSRENWRFYKRYYTGRDVQYTPSLQTGTAAIMEILSSSYKEVYITGITVYHSGQNMFQEKNRIHARPISANHDGTLEMRLFMDFLINEIQTKGNLKRIKVDEVLYNIITLYVDIYRDAFNQKTFWAGEKVAKKVTNQIRDKHGDLRDWSW